MKTGERYQFKGTQEEFCQAYRCNRDNHRYDCFYKIELRDYRGEDWWQVNSIIEPGVWSCMPGEHIYMLFKKID